MQTAPLNVKQVKEIIIKFPRKEKMEILRELERDLLPKRFNRLLNRLKDIPLTYDEINNEVEYARSERYKKES
jgi:DNA-binding HxlR family transcriptional regulator